MLKIMTVRAAVGLALAGSSMAAYASADAPQAVDIPAGDLRQALRVVTLSVGAQNLFNTFPEKDRRSLDPVYGLPGNGNQYIDASPFGYNGAFWYSRVGVTF
jgi:iron complex outermembrane receptor protein